MVTGTFLELVKSLSAFNELAVPIEHKVVRLVFLDSLSRREKTVSLALLDRINFKLFLAKFGIAPENAVIGLVVGPVADALCFRVVLVFGLKPFSGFFVEDPLLEAIFLIKQFPELFEFIQEISIDSDLVKQHEPALLLRVRLDLLHLLAESA